LAGRSVAAVLVDGDFELHADGAQFVDRARRAVCAFPMLRRARDARWQRGRGRIAAADIDEAAEDRRVVANAAVRVSDALIGGTCAGEVIFAAEIRIECGRGVRDGFDGIEHVAVDSGLFVRSDEVESWIRLNCGRVAFEEDVDFDAELIETREHAGGEPFLEVELRVDGRGVPIGRKAKPAVDFDAVDGVVHHLGAIEGAFDEVCRSFGVRQEQRFEGRTRGSAESGDFYAADDRDAVFEGKILHVAIRVLRGVAPEFGGFEAVTPAGGFVKRSCRERRKLGTNFIDNDILIVNRTTTHRGGRSKN
jgi:hypothetical protein